MDFPWNRWQLSEAAVLRTSQHGIYHAEKIAKIRRMIGTVELPPDSENLWEKQSIQL